MSRVIEIEGERPAVLTERETGGMFGGQLLHDAPLEAHLTAEERVEYVLRNRRGGLVVDGAVHAAGDGYQTLLAVTTLRLLVVVGKPDGDGVHSVPLSEVVSVSVTDGIVTSRLVWTTTDGVEYAVPCRGTLDPVAECIDDRAGAWARALRLREDARESLESAADSHAAGEYGAALSATEAAREAVRTARDRVADLGAGALAAFDAAAATTRRRARERRRAIHAARGREARAEGRARWQDGEFERAYDRYDAAIAAFRAARDEPGSDPPPADLSERLERAVAEREELARAPLARAQQLAEGAASVESPAPAARRWERAIRRHQEVLYLDWGREERRFEGDRERITESIVDAVDSLVTERRAAARACRDAARDLRMAAEREAAVDAYRTALSHLDRARAVVEEVAPARETGLDDTVAAIEEEIDAVEGDRSPVEAGHTADRDRLADRLEGHGWTVENGEGGLLATAPGPLELTAYVRVVGRGPTVDDALLAECARARDRTGADVAVVATGGETTDAAVEGVHVAAVESLPGEREGGGDGRDHQRGSAPAADADGDAV